MIAMNTYSIVFTVLAGLLVHTDGRATRMWRNCASSGGPVTLTNINISPNPVSLPGDMHFTMEGYSNRTLGSSRLSLKIKRLGTWFNLPIPCLFNIGSCEYPDMCTLLDQMIHEDWLGITHNLGSDIKRMLLRNGLEPDLCPQPPQTIAIRNEPLQLPRMPAVLSWFAAGLYQATVKVYDNSNNQLLVCFVLRVNVVEREAECSGWFGCMFQ